MLREIGRAGKLPGVGHIMSKTLIVLAAGIGSRYGGLKQVDPVGPSGEIVVDYSIFDAIRAGFDHVVFVIRRQIEKEFKAAVGARFEEQIDVDYAFQELDAVPSGFAVPPERQKPWGTGHAILVCKHVVNEPFAVINADDFYGRRSFHVLDRFLHDLLVHETHYCMVGFILRNTLSEHGHVARGVCDVDVGGHLKSVVERSRIEKAGHGARYAGDDGQWYPLSGDELASMNMWGFTPSIFGFLEEAFPRFLEAQAKNPKAEFYIPTVVDTLIREKRATVKVLETPDKWFGVTYPEDKPAVVRSIRALIKAGLYPERLWTHAGA